VNDEPHVPGVRGQPAFQHHVTAADNGERHDRQAGFKGEIEAAGLERPDPPIATPRALGKEEQRQTMFVEPIGPREDLVAIRPAAVDGIADLGVRQIDTHRHAQLALEGLARRRELDGAGGVVWRP